MRRRHTWTTIASMCALLGSLSACAGTPENVSFGTVESAAEGRTMSYSVYTPPGWDGQTELPLVVFLHGGGDDETVLREKAMVAQTFDEWITAGKLDPFIMVAPDGERGFWTNWYDGTHSYEDYVTQDVIPEIYASYPIAPGRENLHLMGISMGGAGTMYTAINNIEMFASATVLSAPVFDEDMSMRFLEGKVIRNIPVERLFGPPDLEQVRKSNPYTNLSAPEDLHGTKLLVGVGRSDLPGLLDVNRKFHAHLEQHEVPHHYIEYRGGHGWRAWSQLFPVALCLHMRGEGCELEADRFYSLERATALGSVAQGSAQAGL